MRIVSAGLPLLLVSAACTPTVNTLPPMTAPTTPTRDVLLQIPDGLEIRSVDYDVALYSDVSGGDLTFTSVGGRAFVKVVAVDRRTGEQVLLLYENITKRPTPIQVIRFRSTKSDSTGR